MCFEFESALKLSNKKIPKLTNLMTVQMLQVLTSASVIGDSFSSNLLDNSYKVVVEKHLQTSTLQILREAEDRDLIELIMID